MTDNNDIVIWNEGLPSIFYLADMEDEHMITLRFSSGETREIEIPKPDKLDKYWAKKIPSTSIEKRQEMLPRIFNKNQVWRLAYLLAMDEANQTTDRSKSILKLDALINLSDFTGSWGLLAKAIEMKKDDIVYLLLVSGADIGRVADKRQNTRPLRIALEQNNQEMLRLLLAEGAKICAGDLDSATSASIKGIMKEHISKTKQKSLPATEEKSDVVWEKMSNQIISKTVKNSSSSLQTSFNFQAGRMIHNMEILDQSDDKVVHRHEPIIEYFKDTQSFKEIEEAYEQLVEKGGTPNRKIMNRDYSPIRRINKKINS